MSGKVITSFIAGGIFSSAWWSLSVYHGNGHGEQWMIPCVVTAVGCMVISFWIAENWE